MNPPALLRPATRADREAINAIYNREVLEGVATWDEEPWTPEARLAWFEAREPSFPALVADVEGSVAGYAYLSLYRPRSGYRFTRENTLYIEPAHQGRGIGRLLLGALIEQARAGGIHSVIAVIEAQNAASIALHERFGYTIAGTKHEAGFKFGRWLDVVEMELLL